MSTFQIENEPGETNQNATAPHGGFRGFRSPYMIGLCVTKFAPHKALEFIARCKLTRVEMVVLHRVAGYAQNQEIMWWLERCRSFHSLEKYLQQSTSESLRRRHALSLPGRGACWIARAKNTNALYLYAPCPNPTVPNHHDGQHLEVNICKSQHLDQVDICKMRTP